MGGATAYAETRTDSPKAAERRKESDRNEDGQKRVGLRRERFAEAFDSVKKTEARLERRAGRFFLTDSGGTLLSVGTGATLGGIVVVGIGLFTGVSLPLIVGCVVTGGLTGFAFIRAFIAAYRTEA